MKKTSMMTAAPVEPTESKLVAKFKAARRVSEPLVAIETYDPSETVTSVAKILNGDAPIVQWDIVQGLTGVNKTGETFLSQQRIGGDATINPVEMLMKIRHLPTGSCVFLMNFHRQLADVAVIQGLWNLRDEFKMNRRTIVPLGPKFSLPVELANDVIVLREPLPTTPTIEEIILKQHKNAGLIPPTGDLMLRAIDALIGLPAYTAEQVVALSLTKNGLDYDALWERKCQAIEQTEGLKVLRDPTRFADLRGLDNVIAFADLMVKAHLFGIVVLLDEGDKVLAGGMSDHVGDSGVAKDAVACILQAIQTRKHPGLMFGGLAGTGKTALAQAIANEAGKPCIVLDLGGMKSSAHGHSEGAIRTALDVIEAMAGGQKVLYIMTANNTSVFSPEINRRFPDQFYFDNPTMEAVNDLFALYGEKNDLSAEQLARPSDFGQYWTGAEVERACTRAAQFDCTVVEAAAFIVPQAISQAEKIQRMRAEAHGKFTSANYAGFYIGPADKLARDTDRSRPIQL